MSTGAYCWTVFYLGISGGGGSFPPPPESKIPPPRKKGTLQCSVICSDVIFPPEIIKFPPEKHEIPPPQKNTPMIMCWKTSSTTPPLENLWWKRSQLPPTLSNLRNFIDSPPRNLSGKRSNYPPRIYETSSTPPPRNSPQRCVSTPQSMETR